MTSTRIVTAYDWVPPFASGQVRDLRLRWALEEAGLPYEIELVRMGTQTEAENIARQPFGQVPVLVEDGEAVFESGACLWRIATGSDALLPEDPAERQRCLSWVFAALNSIEPPLTMMAQLKFYEWSPERFGLPDGSSASTTLQPPVADWAHRRIGQFEDALGGRDTIVGQRFTVADIAVTAVLLIAERLDLLDAHEGAARYFAAHTSRPAFRKAREAQMATHRENAAKYGAV